MSLSILPIRDTTLADPSSTESHVRVGDLCCHPAFATALSTQRFYEPTLLLALDLVRKQFEDMRDALRDVHIHYAVKANPTPEVVALLNEAGCSFDVASIGEILLCLAAGVSPSRMSFGNVVKHARDIRTAYELGIRLFAADAEEELRKLATHAPGASVFVRILIVGETAAEWPLSDKSGCSPAMAHDLLDTGRALGLDMAGISFHVGSQTRAPEMWSGSLDYVAAIWHGARARGHALRVLNVGGGFPASYGRPVVNTGQYCRTLLAMVHDRFGVVEQLIAEPGRGLVAEAGLIVAEVLLTARKDRAETHRWIYLNIGKFSGLAETMEEAIRYKFVTPHDGTPTGDCVLAGPSCDSIDVLYRNRMVQLPLALEVGDPVLIEDTGAYTSSYASVGFNGFPPLKTLLV